MMKRYVALILLAIGCCQSVGAADTVTLRICTDGIEIASNDAEARQITDNGMNGGGIIVICKKMQIAYEANAYTATCDDLIFITSVGIQGTAKHAEFNLKTKRAVFVGEKDSPLSLTLNFVQPGPDEVTTLVTEKIEMNITAKRNTLNDAGKIPQPIQSYERVLPPGIYQNSSTVQQAAPLPALSISNVQNHLKASPMVPSSPPAKKPTYESR